MTTPEIDDMIHAAANAGAWASKLCGSGGGGCMMTIAPPAQRQAVIDALGSKGASYMNAKLTRTGVEVIVS